MTVTTRSIRLGGEAVKRGPYAHLTDRDLDEVIADWTYGDPLPEDRSSAFRLVHALIERVHRRIQRALQSARRAA